MAKFTNSPFSGLPTAIEVRELFHYDPETGIFWHLKSGPHWKARQVAGGRDNDKLGRPYVSIRHKKYRAHRIAWLYMTGEWPKNLIDHKDNDASNNRWENLREANKSQNAANMRVRAKSGFKGVKRDRHKFQARITVSGREIYLGSFPTPELAHTAYMEAARLHWGEFARAA